MVGKVPVPLLRSLQVLPGQVHWCLPLTCFKGDLVVVLCSDWGASPVPHLLVSAGAAGFGHLHFLPLGAWWFGGIGSSRLEVLEEKGLKQQTWAHPFSSDSPLQGGETGSPDAAL